MRPSSFDANIYLIRLNLSHVRYGCAQMVLKRVAGNAREDVNQAIIAQLGQESLLIGKGILLYDTGVALGTLVSLMRVDGMILARAVVTNE